VSFLATRRAGLEVLLGLDNLDNLGLQEDVLAAIETLEAIVHLLGGGEHPCELAHPRHVRIHKRLGDLLGLQGGKHRTQLGRDTHLGG